MRRLPRSVLLISLLLAALLSSAPVAGQPRAIGVGEPTRGAVIANLDPALLAGPAPLVAPLVFAHGNLGIPRVITWANTAGTSGIAWGTTAAITAANAYISYNATDMLVNVPTATGILFRENEVTHVSIAATGAVLLDGTDDVVQLTVQGFSTQTTLPFVVENSAGADQFTVSNAGAVVALGTLTLTGDATLNGGTGALTVNGNGFFDGSTDVVQLTVQANAASQVAAVFVVENSAGTDLVTINVSGEITGASTLTLEGDATLNGGTGALTVAGNGIIDGSTDVVQLTVQGFTTQTTLPFVVENSAGTDVFTVSNAGGATLSSSLSFTDANVRIIESGTNILTFNAAGGVLADGQADVVQLTVQANATQNGSIFTIEDSAGADIWTFDGATANGLTSNRRVLIDGAADVVQLTVQGNATQTTLPFVVENSALADQFTVSNVGAVVALGTGTWTGDMTLNGGTAALSFGTGESVTTADAGLNIGSSLIINGASDVPQLIINAFGNQASVLLDVRNDAGTTLFSVSTPGEVIVRNQFGTLVSATANATGLGGQINAAHISGGGGSTTGAVAGTGCGTSSLPTQSGNDIGGTLGVTCGTAGTTTNPFVTITFADAYSTAPFCTIDGANAATVAGTVLSQHVAVTTTTTLAVQCGGGTCTTGTLLWSYHCTQ